MLNTFLVTNSQKHQGWPVAWAAQQRLGAQSSIGGATNGGRKKNPLFLLV